MKKILKNKKGFTLVELLAVIVVLAIIMVIATQRIGNVIKQNTADAFKSSLDMVAKSAKQAEMLAEGTLLISDITKLVDYDDGQYKITFGTITNANDSICLTTKSGGKFEKVDLSYLPANSSNFHKAKCTENAGCDSSGNAVAVGATPVMAKGEEKICKKFK